MVKKELGLIEPEGRVFKLMGPVLVPQELVEVSFKGSSWSLSCCRSCKKDQCMIAQKKQLFDYSFIMCPTCTNEFYGRIDRRLPRTLISALALLKMS